MVEIVFVSTETLSTAREVPTIAVKVPAAAVLAPMVAPSIAPPSISGVFMSVSYTHLTLPTNREV